jgi:hypothetical protein
VCASAAVFGMHTAAACNRVPSMHQSAHVSISCCAQLVCGCSMQCLCVPRAGATNNVLAAATCHGCITAPQYDFCSACIPCLRPACCMLLLQAGLLPSSPVAASCAMIPDDDEAGSPLQQIEADMELMLQVRGGGDAEPQQQLSWYALHVGRKRAGDGAATWLSNTVVRCRWCVFSSSWS